MPQVKGAVSHSKGATPPHLHTHDTRQETEDEHWREGLTTKRVAQGQLLEKEYPRTQTRGSHSGSSST